MTSARGKAADPDIVAAREFLIKVYEERYERARKSGDLEKGINEDAASLWRYLIDRDTRTFCILAVSFMEDVLRRAFEHHWAIKSKADANDYFGSNGPLNTFSQRILVAVGLNWMTPEDAKLISLLRKIRNEFAHNHRVHRLDQDPLLSLADALAPIERVWYREDNPHFRDAYDQADRETILRMRVYVNSMFQVSNLLNRAKLIGAELPPDFRTTRGWAGLSQIEQDFIDHAIRHCYITLGVNPSDKKPLE
jgi:hypothetical protein